MAVMRIRKMFMAMRQRCVSMGMTMGFAHGHSFSVGVLMVFIMSVLMVVLDVFMIV